MTKRELELLKMDAMTKYAEYLKADEELAEEGSPGGFIGLQFIQHLTRKQREYEEAQAKWNAALLIYAFERQGGQD